MSSNYDNFVTITNKDDKLYDNLFNYFDKIFLPFIQFEKQKYETYVKNYLF